MNRLELRGIQVSINGTLVCQELSANFERGQCWALLGRNGVGKTTLLHSLFGLYPIIKGSIYLHGTDIKHIPRRTLARSIGLLPQTHSDSFPTTVLETVLLGRFPYMGIWRNESAEDIELARASLATVGLTGMEHRTIDTLSGGERRRLGIAMLLTQRPDIYLLDEPTNHLDLKHQLAVLTHLTKNAKSDGTTLVMSIHDINLASRYCDYVIILMNQGHVLLGPTREFLKTEVLSELYEHPVMSIQTPHGEIFVPT